MVISKPSSVDHGSEIRRANEVEGCSLDLESRTMGAVWRMHETNPLPLTDRSSSNHRVSFGGKRGGPCVVAPCAPARSISVDSRALYSLRITPLLNDSRRRPLWNCERRRPYEKAQELPRYLGRLVGPEGEKILRRRKMLLACTTVRNDTSSYLPNEATGLAGPPVLPV